MDVEDHGAGMVTQSGVGMCGAMIEKLRDSDCCGFDACRLGGGEGAKGDQHGGVDSACVIEDKGANDFQEPCARGQEEWGGDVGGCGKLDGHAVRGRYPGMGSMLCSGCGDVLKSSKSAGDVARHGNVDMAHGEVPSESEASRVCCPTQW
jgi:hypothetical protein